MSWSKSDEYMGTVRSIVSGAARNKKAIVTGKNLVLTGQLFWEDGSKRPSRPSHSHRLMQFSAKGSKPVLMLKGYQTGTFDVLLSAKSTPIIQLCSARQLKVLSPEPETSQLKYGCLFKSLGLEGATYAAEVIVAALDAGLLDFGNLKL